MLPITPNMADGTALEEASRATGVMGHEPVTAHSEGELDECGSVLLLSEDEELSYLTGHWRIIQHLDRHRYSTDDLVTSYYACEYAVALYGVPYSDLSIDTLDMGCGLGSVLLSNAWQLPASTATGIEVQPTRYAMAKRSIAINLGSEQNRVQVYNVDLRSIIGPLNLDDQSERPLPIGLHRGYDMITGTPPYFDAGQTSKPSDIETSGCLFELRGGVEDYCMAASRLLRRPSPSRLSESTHLESDSETSGNINEKPSFFVMCNTSLASSRVYRAAETAGLTVVKRLDVIPRDGKLPLFTVFTLIANDWLLTPHIHQFANRWNNNGSALMGSLYSADQRAQLVAELPVSSSSGRIHAEVPVYGEICDTLLVRERNLQHSREYSNMLHHLGKPSSFDREMYPLTARA